MCFPLFSCRHFCPRLLICCCARRMIDGTGCLDRKRLFFVVESNKHAENGLEEWVRKRRENKGNWPSSRSSLMTSTGGFSAFALVLFLRRMLLSRPRWRGRVRRTCWPGRRGRWWRGGRGDGWSRSTGSSSITRTVRIMGDRRTSMRLRMTTMVRRTRTFVITASIRWMTSFMTRHDVCSSVTLAGFIFKKSHGTKQET